MRNHLLTFVFAALVCAAVLPAQAQSASGWDRVQALPSSTAIHVKGRTHSAHCKLKSVEADSLTCVSGDGAKTEVFQKTDIKTIKIPHRGRSALAGAAIGAGAGAIAGAATGQNGQIIGRGGLAVIFAVPLAIIGALVGVATDFTVATIYHA